MKKVLKRLAMLSVAMLLAFAGCEKDPGSENDNSNNGGGDTGNVSGTIAGHDYVDLGLPSGLKWATCNVGASQPHEYGNYYAWGETTTKSSYTEENCRTWNVSMNDISGNATYDAATANWGSTWRMPTKAEMRELYYQCTWKWTSQSGVNGYRVTGPNGNSIFLPAAGCCDGSSRSYVGEFGNYWSSTTDSEGDTDFANFLYFDSDYLSLNFYYRNLGRSVRPVSE